MIQEKAKIKKKGGKIIRKCAVAPFFTLPHNLSTDASRCLYAITPSILYSRAGPTQRTTRDRHTQTSIRHSSNVGSQHHQQNSDHFTSLSTEFNKLL
jgi:hypothetical protein